MRNLVFLPLKVLCAIFYISVLSLLNASEEVQESTETTLTTLTYTSDIDEASGDDYKIKTQPSPLFFNTEDDVLNMGELIIDGDTEAAKRIFNAISPQYLHEFWWHIILVHKEELLKAIEPLWGAQGILFRRSGEGPTLPPSYLDQQEKHVLLEVLNKASWGETDIDMNSRVLWTIYYDFYEWQKKKEEFLDDIDQGKRQALSELGVKGTINSIIKYKKFMLDFRSFFQAMYFLVSHRLPHPDRQSLTDWMANIDGLYKRLHRRMLKIQEAFIEMPEGGEGFGREKEPSPRAKRKNSKNSNTPSLGHRIKEKFSHHGDDHGDSSVLKRSNTSPEFKSKELPRGSTSPKSPERKHHKH